MYRANSRDGLAWVTGASSGIGRATALELARRGYRVAASARRVDELEALSSEAAANGMRIDAFPGDVTDREGMAALVARIEAQAGPIALALFNVGASFKDAPGDWCGEGFRKTMDVNFDSALNGLAPLIPRMIARGRGQIGVMSSVAGYGGLPGAAAYCASKAALIVTCQSLRQRLYRAGVSIQVICPGFVRTSLTDDAAFPMPFMIEVEDAARRICDGFERKGFEIAFPRRIVWALKFLHRLPYPMYFWLMGKAAKSR